MDELLDAAEENAYDMRGGDIMLVAADLIECSGVVEECSIADLVPLIQSWRNRRPSPHPLDQRGGFKVGKAVGFVRSRSKEWLWGWGKGPNDHTAVYWVWKWGILYEVAGVP